MADDDFAGWCANCKHHHSWHRIGQENDSEAARLAVSDHYRLPYCRGLKVPDETDKNALNRGVDSRCVCVEYKDEGMVGYR